VKQICIYNQLCRQVAGYVHDARILRETTTFDAFESDQLTGFTLSDSGYMLQDWLMTPIVNIRSPMDECRCDS
jgi:hypothetical protein